MSPDLIGQISFCAGNVHRLIRIGSLVMVVHDVSDVFLETAKIFNYVKDARPWAQVGALNPLLHHWYDLDDKRLNFNDYC